MPGRLTRREGRALLVAEAPCRGARPGHRALDGPAGDRLAGYWFCVGRGEEPPAYMHGGRALLLDRFDTVNLLGRWPGGEGKGAAWPREAARRAARRLSLRGVVVLLGLRVRDAYAGGCAELRLLEFGQWGYFERGGGWADVTVLPHPSGIVRNYNDPAARELAGRTLLEAERLARGG